jgi:hypothetical protein
MFRANLLLLLLFTLPAFAQVDFEPTSQTCTTVATTGELVQWGPCNDITPPPPEPTLVVSANPLNVVYGGTTTVSWDAENVSSCMYFGAGQSFTVPLSGSQSASLTEDTTFTLTCDSLTQSVTVTADDPIVIPPPDPEPGCFDGCTANADGSYSCSWRDRQETACHAGYTEQFSGWRWIYTPDVTPPPPPPPPPPPVEDPTLSVSADPLTIQSGGSTTLSWAATNVSSCTATALGQTAPVGLSGSQIMVLTATSTFSVTCDALTESVTVTVDGGTTPPPDPDPDPPPPSTASCDNTYRGIPDPCAHLGYDVFADYPADIIVTGSQSNISGNGSASDPYVVDATGLNYAGTLTVSGSYVIVDGGYVDAPQSNNGGLNMSGCSYCTVRDLEVFGSASNFDVGHSAATSIGSNNVLLRLELHGFGDRRVSAREQDFHGLKTYSSNVWVLDSEIYDVSGDSIQCGDASRGSCSNVYIGGGFMHDNRENGVDIKDSRNVVVSGVRMSGFRSTASSPGEAVIVHDDSFNAKIYDNIISDSIIGIVSSGASGHIIDGNTIQAISEGIQLRNTSSLTVTNNTINAPTCVNNQGGTSGNIQTGCN